MSVGVRISEIRNNIRKNTFANDLGITPDYLRMLESGEKNPGKTLIKLICHKFHLNEKWLTTGDGEKHQFATLYLDSQDNLEKQFLPINIYSFEFFSQNYSIGKQLTYQEALSVIMLPPSYASDNTIALKISNNAMEPTIVKNSIIGVNLDKRDLEDGGLYLIKTKNSHLLVRHIYLQGSYLTLTSNNKNFPEINIETKELEDGLILGTVAWVLQNL